MTTIVQELSNMHLFRSSSLADIRGVLDHCSAEFFHSGDIICQQGAIAENAMILVRGSLGVYIKSQLSVRKVGEIHPGEIFGERGLIQINGIRNATVKATSDSMCLGLTPRSARKVSSNPVMVALNHQLLISMARRLRSTNLAMQKIWKECTETDLDATAPTYVHPQDLASSKLKFGTWRWFLSLFT